MEENYLYKEDLRSLIKNIDNPLSKKLLDKEDYGWELKKQYTFVDLADSTKLVKIVTEKHTQKMKVGKFIKKLVGDTKPHEVEDFVNKFKSNQSKGSFEIVKGDDIVKYYDSKNYTKKYEPSSSLYESCMNDLPKSFFDIYTKNDNISLLILKDDYDKVSGRAIIFSGVESSDGYKDFDYMVRPYTSHQYLENKFKNYAEENNIFFDGDFIKDDKQTGLKVKLKHTEFSEYPYVDVLQDMVNGHLCREDYQEDGKSIICGFDLTNLHYYKILCRTDGSYDKYEGYFYYETFGDYTKDTYSTTFDDSKIEMCCITNEYFLKENVKIFESIYDIKNPRLKKIAYDISGEKPNIKINSEFCRIISPSINIDTFENKNDRIYFSYNLFKFFQSSIIDKDKQFSSTLGSNGDDYSLYVSYKYYDLEGLRPMYSLQPIVKRFKNVNFKVENGNLFIHFRHKSTPYFICFIPKSSGMTFEIYDSKPEKMFFGRRYGINKRISKMSKGEVKYSDLFRKLKNEIIKIGNKNNNNNGNEK